MRMDRRVDDRVTSDIFSVLDDRVEALLSQPDLLQNIFFSQPICRITCFTISLTTNMPTYAFEIYLTLHFYDV